MEGLVWLAAVLGAIASFLVFWLWRERRGFENSLDQLRKENKERLQQLEQAYQEIITLQHHQDEQSFQIQSLKNQVEVSQQKKAEIETRLNTEIQILQDSKQKLIATVAQLNFTQDELLQQIRLLQIQLENSRREKAEIESRLEREIQKIINKSNEVTEEIGSELNRGIKNIIDIVDFDF